MSKSWADLSEGSEISTPLPSSLLYRIIDQPTKAIIDDFSPAMHTMCDAIDAAHDDYKQTLDGLVDALKAGTRLPAVTFSPVMFASLVAFHNDSLKRFVMNMRGTLRLLVETEIHDVHHDKPALERVSCISHIAATPQRLKARTQALMKSQNESKRRNADAARRLAKVAEARFYRRVMCVLYGPHHEMDDDQEAWKEASEWAVTRLGSHECVMDRMQKVLSELIRHKRAIDWELDSRWAYEPPVASCHHFVGGTPGTPLV